jgi:hypothetical protein
VRSLIRCNLIAIAITIVIGSPLWALPDSPIAKPSPIAHHYWDKWNKVEAITMTGTLAFDMAQTCNSLAHGGHEMNLPSQKCGVIVGMSIGFDAAAVGLSYALHRLGHHKLERIPMVYVGWGNLHGIIYSRQHHGW